MTVPIRFARRNARRWLTVVVLMVPLFVVASARCEEQDASGDTAAARLPIELRMESLLLAPAHFPNGVVVLRNTGSTAVDATVRLMPPHAWQVTPAEKQVHLAPGEPEREVFSLRGRSSSEDNWYWFSVCVEVGAGVIERKCRVPVTTAPYFKPTIDGQTDDWRDAVPIGWSTLGKRTTISSFWNRRNFCVLVAVEEDRLVARDNTATPCDAVQLALSPRGSRTGRKRDEQACRYEFLLLTEKVPDPRHPAPGKCFLLARPGDLLGQLQQARPLEPLAVSGAQVVVTRCEGITYWECSLPFAPMRKDIRPSEGREFCFSVLVHDPDGTGLRQWSTAAGLWPEQRNRLAWSNWPGAKWGELPPLDNKTPWGMCSSKY